MFLILFKFFFEGFEIKEEIEDIKFTIYKIGSTENSFSRYPRYVIISVDYFSFNVDMMCACVVAKKKSIFMNRHDFDEDLKNTVKSWIDGFVVDTNGKGII